MVWYIKTKGAIAIETSNFSSRIKELRGSCNLTQFEFAEKIGATQATLSSYENSNKTPSLDIVKNIAESFNVSIDWLLGLSDIVDITSKPRTYSDIARMLFKLEEADLCGFSISTFEDNYTDAYHCNISAEDSLLVNFFNEWKKMKDLHDNKTIDNELYDLWIEKTLKKYNIPITHPTKDFTDIPDDLEGLPFN